MNIKTFAMGFGMLALAACGNGPQNPELLKGANFIAAGNGTDITLSFAADQMRVNGSVVNLYNGTYTASGDKITFGPIATTMMMGPRDAMQTEQEYLQFLSTVTNYDLNNGRLTLKNDAGKEIVFTQVEQLPGEAVVTETETVVVSE